MAMDARATVAALDAARLVFKDGIEAHQGRVIDMAGDSVLAVFDTATGAVDAALAIQLSLRGASEAAAPERRMPFRIGVHLGDVIEKPDGTVYGDGVNVAARLQALAEPGGITVSEAVRGVVGGRVSATFIDRGAQPLKNIATPIRAFAVGSAGVANAAADAPYPLAAPGTPSAVAADAQPAAAAAAAPRPAPSPSSLFVGRQQEMARLTKALASARDGRGQVMLLAGSGGIGKTRLAQQMANSAERDGVPVLWGRCLEEPGAPPYWPWRQLIRSYLRGSGDPDPVRTLGAGLADIASIVPELAERFSPQQPDAEAGDTAQMRFRLFDAVAGFWRRAAQRVPHMLIFEDLHWADATSLRLFAFLAAELEDSAIFLIGTYRDTELSRQHPLSETLAELARLSVFHRIELAGLSGRETEEFMAAASGSAASASFVSAIYARTEGHPLFLEETLRYMMETRAPQAYGSVADEPRLLTIPTGVREVIGKRLNRLSVPAGRLLSIAACIGRTFDLDVLVQLEADKSEDEVLLALEEAIALHLIEPVPQTQQFRFGHALIRETLYDEMLGLRRARLHLRIGEVLEQRHGAEDPAALPQLAHHFGEAGPGAPARKALGYATRSAEHAAKLLAFEESVRLYHLALHLQMQHFAKDATQRCELLLGLGRVEQFLGAGQLARAAYQEAAKLARNQGLVALFAQAAIGFETSNAMTARSGEPAVVLLLEAIALHQADDPLRVELLARLCRAYVYSDRAQEAKEANRRAVTLARRIGDMGGLRSALASFASGIYWPELLAERLAAANEAWHITEELGRLQVSDLLSYFLIDLIRVGDGPTLVRLREQGLRISEQSGSLHDQAICRYIEGLVAINEGRFADAEAWATEALQIGRRVAEDIAVGAYGMQMFCLRREQGRLREALPLLGHFVDTTPKGQIWQPGLALLYAELDMREESRAQFESLPWDRTSTAPRDASTLTIAMFSAEVCVYLRDAARAALLYPMLKGHAGALLVADSAGPCLGSADRLLGSLASVMAQWELAERHFEAALATDSKTASRVWLAHSGHDYAVMLHRRALPGDSDRARALLTNALVESSALGMHALTARITALIDAIAAPPPAFPCGLTEREVGVLRLMAIGRNNREIGQVLAISPNTVANHVRSILEKTYTANRTEAAAFANREGLL